MEQNKIRTYLLYALGEILLVMIGILLALQVNNWNEEVKARAEFNQYLTTIQSNLLDDQVVLDSLIIRRQEIVELTKAAQLSFLNKEFDFNTTRFGLVAYLDFYFAPNISGYESLKNSVYFSRLNGMGLNDLFVEYHATIELIAQAERSYNEFVENIEAARGSETDRTLIMVNNFMDPDELASTQTTQEEIIAVFKELYESSSYRNIVSQAVRTEYNIIEPYLDLKKIGLEIINRIEQMSND
jgi:hypothetical protein